MDGNSWTDADLEIALTSTIGKILSDSLRWKNLVYKLDNYQKIREKKTLFDRWSSQFFLALFFVLTLMIFYVFGSIGEWLYFCEPFSIAVGVFVEEDICHFVAIKLWDCLWVANLAIIYASFYGNVVGCFACWGIVLFWALRLIKNCFSLWMSE